MMVESLKYALPLRKGRPCQMKLRSLKLLQPYDLDKEQELVPMTPQQATWKVFTYFYRDMELRVQELREQPGDHQGRRRGKRGADQAGRG
ncbi:hypothetical protein NXW84_05680 [Bacteroides fragilis]|nr:hypothetical protein NXW84_05680 [Bacteroides fragilis]